MDIFTKLGRWLIAALRGSENGAEDGALHILRTDADGRLEVAAQPVTAMLTGYDYNAEVARAVAVDADGVLQTNSGGAATTPAAFYHCEVGFDSTGNVYSANHTNGLPLLSTDVVIGLLRFWVTEALAATGSLRLRAIAVSSTTGDIYRHCAASWGSIGETYNTHTWSSGYAAVPIASANQYTIIVDGTLSPISAGDLVTVTFLRGSNDPSDTIEDTVYLTGAVIEPV